MLHAVYNFIIFTISNYFYAVLVLRFLIRKSKHSSTLDYFITKKMPGLNQRTLILSYIHQNQLTIIIEQSFVTLNKFSTYCDAITDSISY